MDVRRLRTLIRRRGMRKMKWAKLGVALAVVALLVVAACGVEEEGLQGSPGPQGPAGETGSHEGPEGQTHNYQSYYQPRAGGEVSHLRG